MASSWNVSLPCCCSLLLVSLLKMVLVLLVLLVLLLEVLHFDRLPAGGHSSRPHRVTLDVDLLSRRSGAPALWGYLGRLGRDSGIGSGTCPGDRHAMGLPSLILWTCCVKTPRAALPASGMVEMSTYHGFRSCKVLRKC